MTKRNPEKRTPLAAHSSVLPPDFLWGGVLSAHCVEGNDTNSDWWHWEQRPGRIAGDQTSDRAANFLNRADQDIPRFQNLNLNALCVSLSWARIAPSPGEFDSVALDHYARLLHTMNDAGLRPFVVLWDRALPEWFALEGAWTNPRAVHHFEEYASRVIAHLEGLCRDWLPFWLPESWLHQVYTSQYGPAPRGLGWRHVWSMRNRIFHAWAAARAQLRAAHPDNQVGAAIAYGLHWPRDRYSVWDTRQARLRMASPAWWLKRYENAAHARPDFIMAVSQGWARARFSLPAYARDAFLHSVPPRPAAGFDQDALYTLVEEEIPTETPVYLIVDGVARGAQESQIVDLLTVVETALQNGRSIRGLFLNPLMDGFQWTQGWSAPRGLIHVHPKTLSRTPNSAAFLLRDIIAAGGLKGVSRARNTGWPRHGAHK